MTLIVFTLSLLLGGSLSAGVQNLTTLPVDYGSVKFSWFPTTSLAEDTYTYYMVCSPDLYQGDYPEDLIYLTRSTSMVLSGFQESTGYTCTLSTLDNEGSLHDDSVHINVKSLGGISINFINNSPVIQGSSITAEFKVSGSVTSLVCCLNPKPQSGNKCVQCWSGRVSYSNMSPGYYRLIIVAKNSNYDSVVTKRLLTVPDTSYSCAVNLINDGFTLSESSVTIQFTGVGAVSRCACYLNQQVYDSSCTSPFVLENLESGSHSLKIIPVGDDCVERLPLKLTFQL